MLCRMRPHIFNQILSSITAFLTVFTSGLWLGWMSSVLPRLESGEIPIAMTSDALTWTVALMDVGTLLSPLPAGFLMDRCGRLLVLRLTAVSYVLAATLALAASQPFHLYLARLLAGMGKGAAFTTATLYVGEIAAPNIRGALCGIFALMSLSGTLTSMTLGPFTPFRTLNLILLAIPVLGLALTFFIVESPYFLLMRAQDEAAGRALSRLRDTRGMSMTSNRQTELAELREKVHEEALGREPFWRLITLAPNRRALTMVLVTGVLERAGGISCIFAYASTTLPSNPWDPAVSVMLFSWLNVLFALIGMSLVDNLGRKPLMVLSAFGLTLILAVTAVYYFLSQNTMVDVSGFSYVPHVGLMLYAPFYAIGVGQIPHTLHSELLPASVRSQASAIVSMCLGISSFITTKAYLVVDETIGVYFMYVIFAVASMSNMLFCTFYLVETKGKSLVEIHALLSDRRALVR